MTITLDAQPSHGMEVEEAEYEVRLACSLTISSAAKASKAYIYEKP